MSCSICPVSGGISLITSSFRASGNLEHPSRFGIMEGRRPSSGRVIHRSIRRICSRYWQRLLLTLQRLHIRRIERWITLPEEGRLPSIIPKREGGSKFPDARNEDVISEIPPDTGQMLHDIDTGTCSVSPIAHTRLHQHPRRVDRTERKDDLAASSNPIGLAATKEFNSGRPFAVEYDARHKRAGEYCKIGAVHIGIGIGTKDGQAAAVTNTQIGDGCAAFTLHHFTVLVVEGRNAQKSDNLEHRRGHRIGIARRFHIGQAAFATPLRVGGSLPVLNATVYAEDGFIAPAGITRFVSEIIPVILVSTRPNRSIDARGATEHLPHVKREPAPIEQWIGFGLKVPVPFRSEIGEPLSRFSYARHVVGAPCLE